MKWHRDALYFYERWCYSLLKVEQKDTLIYLHCSYLFSLISRGHNSKCNQIFNVIMYSFANFQTYLCPLVCVHHIEFLIHLINVLAGFMTLVMNLPALPSVSCARRYSVRMTRKRCAMPIALHTWMERRYWRVNRVRYIIAPFANMSGPRGTWLWMRCNNTWMPILQQQCNAEVCAVAVSGEITPIRQTPVSIQ